MSGNLAGGASGGLGTSPQKPLSGSAGTKRPAPSDESADVGRQLRSGKKTATGTAKPSSTRPSVPPPVPQREVAPATKNDSKSHAKSHSATNSPCVDANSTSTVVSDVDLTASDGFTTTLDDVQHSSLQSVKNLEHFIFNLPLNGKSYTPKLITKEMGRGATQSTRWVFTCIDSSNSILYFGTERTTVYTRTEAEQISQALVDMLERLPANMSPGCITTTKYMPPRKPVWLVHFVLRAALSHTAAAATSANLLRASAPKYTVQGKGNGVAIVLHTLEPDTLKPCKNTFWLSSGHISGDYVEDIPDNTMEFSADLAVTWQTKDTMDPDFGNEMTFPSGVPDGGDALVRKRYKNLERLGRRILYELHGKVMKQETVKIRIERIIQLHGGQTQTKLGLYANGTKIWYFDRDRSHRVIRFKPSDSAKASGFRAPCVISVPTLDSSWVTKIVDKLEEVYAATSSLVDAWVEGASVANTITEAIKDGDKPPSHCPCTSDHERNTKSHACTKCRNPCICASRQLDPMTNLPICAKCFLQASIAISRGSTSKRLPFTQIFLEKLISKRLYHESIMIDLDRSGEVFLQNKADLKQWTIDCLANMKSEFEWQSQATKRIYTIESQSSGRGHQETKFDDPSVDAMGPIGINHNTYLVHCLGNCWLIEQCLNYAKHIQIPPFLDVLANNVRFHLQDPANISAEQLKNWERAVISKANICHEIRIRFAYRLKTRVAQPVSGKKLALDLEEVFSGKLGTKRLVDKSKLYIFKLPPSNVPAEKFEVLRKRSYELQQFYGVKLVEANGCPYFLHEKTMPPDWGWVMCLTICRDRMIRMRDLCNRTGTTCETPETIYIFCIVVACVRKCFISPNDPKTELKRRQKQLFVELLSLPLALLPFHGLRFALGHIHHGQNMDTGVDIDTLEFDETKCNVIMEACTTNFLKGNYPESTYPNLVKTVGAIDIRGTPAFNQDIELTDRVDDDEDVMAAPLDDAVLRELERGRAFDDIGDAGDDAGGYDSDSDASYVDDGAAT